MDLGL
jgi:3-oxoacyl-[acyl-carrier protein] reductase